MKAFSLFPAWLQIPALVVATLFQLQGSEWALPKGFLTDGFQIEWIQIGRESPQSPWVVKSRQTPELQQIDVFFPDSVLTNGVGSTTGPYTVPSVIFNADRQLVQLHPAFNSSNPDEVLASIAWIAPEPGTYTAVGDFAVGNLLRADSSACCPNGTDYWIYRDEEINDRLWQAGSPTVSADATNTFARDAARPFAVTTTVEKGTLLHFAVRPRASENFDATLLRLRIARAEGQAPVAAAELRDVQVPVSGANIALEFPATGLGAGFQWYRDGTYYTNTLGPLLSIPPTGKATTNFFQAVVTNAFGAITSRVALVAFWPRPWILTQPPALIVTTNTTAEVSLKWIPRDGVLPILYRNGQIVARDFRTLSDVRFVVRENGTYTIRVGSGSSVTNSEPAQVFFVKSEPETPRLLLPGRSENEGNLEVTVQVEAGRNYRLERSTDILSWNPVREWFADQAQLTTSVAEPNGTVFYRVVIVSTPLTEAPLGIEPREPPEATAQGR